MACVTRGRSFKNPCAIDWGPFPHHRDPVRVTQWDEVPKPGNPLVHILGRLSRWNPKLAFRTQRARRDQRRGRSVAILTRELAYAAGRRWPQDKVDLCTHPPESSEFREFLTGFSRVQYPSGFNTNLLSQGYFLEMAGSMGIVGGRYILRMGEGERSLCLPGIQITDQPVVTSSWLPHPTEPPCWLY